ncbi:MAG: NAD(P)H-binding protein [Pseudomonadota bacterium]
MQTKPILVIGATGKTGSRVTRRLERLGYPVRRGTRGAAIPFDWDKPETWARALDGVSKAYVTYFPDIAIPGAVERVEALCADARKAGVERLVMLTGRGEHHARRGEEAVRASGVDFTLIRAAWFAQNFSEGYLRDPILSGVMPMPGGDVREPIIDVEDIADVATAVLTEDTHSGELYEVTGPRLMTFAEMATAMTAAIGRPIRHLPITLQDFHASVRSAAGDFIADILTQIARETLDGRNSYVSDGVERAIGRAPRDFEAFAREAAAAGAWAEAA